MLKSFTRANQQETQDVSFHVWGLIKFPGPSNLWHILETFFFSFFSPSFFTSTVSKFYVENINSNLWSFCQAESSNLRDGNLKKKKKRNEKRKEKKHFFKFFSLLYTWKLFFYFFPLSFCLAFSSLQTAFVILTCPIMPLDFDKIFVYVYLTSSK